MEQLLAGWGHPSYRARQVLKWVYKGVNDFEAMTDISRTFRQELARRFRLGDLEIEQEQASRDGSRKFLLALKDGQGVESVLIPVEGHYTMCLSTQVGCAMGCRF